MIVPIVEEEEWIAAFERLPIWNPPVKPTVVLSPHPDDETLGAGGLIYALTSRGTGVRLIAITDGENAYQGEIGLGAVREREQQNALSELGVSGTQIDRLRLRDSGLHDQEDELISRLRLHIEPGMHLIAPWLGDFHPDHEVCGRAAKAVAESMDVQLTFYFFWTWHRGTPETLDGLRLFQFPLSLEQIARKRRALDCHCSQLVHSSEKPILPECLLKPMARPFEVYLLT